MAKGEKRFSTKGKQARKFESTPLPPGEYELKARGADAKVQKKQEPGSMPYVSVPFEALGTASQEGGKNRVIFHNFFLSLKPGKDGSLMPERADQLVGFAQAAGTDIDLGTISVRDADGNPQDVLSPQEFVAWLKANDGTVVKAKTKVRPGDEKKGYSPRAEITYFIESENAEADEDEEDDDTNSDEETEDDEDEDSDEDEEEIDHSPKKPAKQAKLPLKKGKK